MQFLGQSFQKLEHEQDGQRHTHTYTQRGRQTRPNLSPQWHSRMVIVTYRQTDTVCTGSGNRRGGRHGCSHRRCTGDGRYGRYGRCGRRNLYRARDSSGHRRRRCRRLRHPYGRYSCIRKYYQHLLLFTDHYIISFSGLMQ